MANRCLLLVRLDDILNFEFLPLDATLCARLPLALIVFLILGCNFSLLLLLPHFELYETVLALILVRVARRRPSEINNEKYCEMLIFFFDFSFDYLFTSICQFELSLLCHKDRGKASIRTGRETPKVVAWVAGVAHPCCCSNSTDCCPNCSYDSSIRSTRW